MGWIAQAVDADNVIWMGVVRVLRDDAAQNDAFSGWRLRERMPFRPDSETYKKLMSDYLTSEHYGKLTPTYHSRSHDPKKEAHVGMTSIAALAGAGTFRVHRLRDDWIDFAKFRRTLHYKLYYQGEGIRDRIWIGVPVSEDHESFFLVDRFENPGGARRRGFTSEEARLVGDAVRGLPGLHRWLFLGCGLMVSGKRLSPMEQDLARLLLTSKSEKEIAECLGQKPKTLHKYVTGIYARFGVRGRAAWMALWLGGE